ncbi:MAG: hypothetical protein KJ935_06395 [Candidatus Omnitrophica bacterium]|nr:hypothetical protein [Candidatus Omnitrophota bacterium]
MDERARIFVEQEQEFHLGNLPTEQFHPVTKNLSRAAADSPGEAVKLLFTVDRDVAVLLDKAKTKKYLADMAGEIAGTILNRGRVFFTGCGATGRLAVLLDACWRRFWREMKEKEASLTNKKNFSDFENSVVSVMAGGDFALIKSVEGYEDFTVFGERQMQDMAVGKNDLVIAVTEGGETSFVIGAAQASFQAGARVYYVYNNPDESLVSIRRCREIIAEKGIKKLCLATGPMAVSGSTRMQAVSAELAVLGGAMEIAIQRILSIYSDHANFPRSDMTGNPAGILATLSSLIKKLLSEENVENITRMVLFEKGIYEKRGLVTYLADKYSLDVITDTTERSPTFLVPPFRKKGDLASPISWAFVVRPEKSSQKAWKNLLQRDFNDVKWSREEIKEMLRGKAALLTKFPKLDREEILRFDLSRNSLKERMRGKPDGLVAFLAGDETEKSDFFQPYLSAFRAAAKKGGETAVFFLGTREQKRRFRKNLRNLGVKTNLFAVTAPLFGSCLRIPEHLALKMSLNAVSTLTMVLMGRVLGNMMIFVSPGNKKLYDRATRYVAHLTGQPYPVSCSAFFSSLDFVKEQSFLGDEVFSPVLLAAVCLKKKCLPGEAESILKKGRINLMLI